MLKPKIHEAAALAAGLYFAHEYRPQMMPLSSEDVASAYCIGDYETAADNADLNAVTQEALSQVNGELARLKLPQVEITADRVIFCETITVTATKNGDAISNAGLYVNKGEYGQWILARNRDLDDPKERACLGGVLGHEFVHAHQIKTGKPHWLHEVEAELLPDVPCRSDDYQEAVSLWEQVKVDLAAQGHFVDLDWLMTQHATGQDALAFINKHQKREKYENVKPADLSREKKEKAYEHVPTARDSLNRTIKKKEKLAWAVCSAPGGLLYVLRILLSLMASLRSAPNLR